MVLPSDDEFAAAVHRNAGVVLLALGSGIDLKLQAVGIGKVIEAAQMDIGAIARDGRVRGPDDDEVTQAIGINVWIGLVQCGVCIDLKLSSLLGANRADQLAENAVAAAVLQSTLPNDDGATVWTKRKGTAELVACGIGIDGQLIDDRCAATVERAKLDVQSGSGLRGPDRGKATEWIQCDAGVGLIQRDGLIQANFGAANGRCGENTSVNAASRAVAIGVGPDHAEITDVIHHHGRLRACAASARIDLKLQADRSAGRIKQAAFDRAAGAVLPDDYGVTGCVGRHLRAGVVDTGLLATCGHGIGPSVGAGQTDRHQAGVALLLDHGKGSARFNRTGLPFQNPVATERSGAGQIGTGRNVGTG